MFGRRARNRSDHQHAVTARQRLGVSAVATLFVAASIALGLLPTGTLAAPTGPAGSSGPVLVTSDTHHDTSRPLHSYQATNTKATAHPAKHGPAGPQGPAAPNTSGGGLAPTANAPVATTNFDGTPDNSGVIPSDSDGAAGTTQYFEIVNSQIAVYNKSGGLLLGPENTNTLWSGFGGSCQANNDGDGTVQFDTLSQRWVVEQLEVSAQPFFVCVAVSTSANATGSWNRYSFQYADFPDYPKLGVWPDAYYLTVNRFDASGTTGLGEQTCALNRASMLSGAAATEQCFSLNSSGENTVLPATLNGTTPPAAGTPEWLVGISPTTSNALAYWRLHVDWTTPANSTLSTQTDLPVAAFSEACGGAGTCIPQSGTSQQLDSLGDRLMYSLPYRNFGDHESIMVTHSIVAGSSVGMRWYELRPSGSALNVFQQGTYAPNGTYRWMGSIGIDQSGDVALGYSTSSSTLHPGVAVTGRLASDPAGSMPQGETTLLTGGGSQSGNLFNPGNRWGDYSGMSVDPSDDCTFWYVNQYEPSNGDFNWHTRIASFKFPSCGTVTNDFSISANPTTLSLAANAAGSSTISTAVTSGSAGTVSLGVSGTPAGATASLAASSVTAGQSTTLNVNAGTATPGTYTLTVTGTEGSATHSTTVSLTVLAANDFSISANPTSLSLGPNAAGSSTISTAVTSGSAGTVSLGVSGTPAGASASLAASSVTAGQSTTLNVNAGTATPGTYTLTVTGTEGAAAHSTTVSLTVLPPNDFSISANPASLSLGPNAAGSSTISTAVTSGSAGTVSLGVSGTPAGATASLASSSVTAGQSTTLNVNAGTATPGTYTLTVTGTEGSATHSTTVSLTVTSSGPPPGLTQLSSDPFTDPSAEHATTVEPDTLSHGSTLVSVFQDGRFNDGGADDIGYATTTDGGTSWSQGVLPGLTAQGGGSPNLGWARVSDPSIAYDPKYGVWIAASLTIDSSASGRGVAVNRSTDGVTWSAATNAIAQAADFYDKSWIACDQTSTSSHYGNCYIEFDDNSLGNAIRMLTSTDGGVTWSAARGTSDNAHGLGGQPLVQPNGTVVVPYFNDSGSQMRSFVSTNGGSSWNSSRLISSVTDHAAAGGLRTEPLPSAEIDSQGRVYVVWQDCRFRSGCSSNDIVMSRSSSNGTNWGSVTRIPIDTTTSGADHFIPGLAVDRSTGGASAHLGLYYYYYPVASCTSCSLDVGFISSTNGGSSWGSATQVAGPMTLNELAPTTQGPMVGDYMSASFIAGKAWAVFAVGVPGSGSTLNEAMYTLSGGLAAPGGTRQPDSGGVQGHARGHSSTAF